MSVEHGHCDFVEAEMHIDLLSLALGFGVGVLVGILGILTLKD